MKLLPLILCTGLVVAANFLTAAAADAYPETATPQNSTVREVTRAFLLDRIYGGWAGMLIGGLEGLPHEFKYNEQPRATLPEFTFLEPGARSDDDNDFEWTHLWHMDKEGVLKLPYPRLVEIWKTNMNQGIWVANKRARELMDQGLVPPATGSPSFNPHAGYNLSGQFCVEAYGMIAPGMPQTAAELGLHYARIAVSEEPLQATRFWTSLISLMAFHEGPLETAFEAALAAVDPASAMAEVATDARRLHREHPQDWKTARQAIHEKWVKQKKWNMNSTPSNGALVLLALLYGEGDFYPTLQYAMALGYDADCNAATAGAVLGTRLGFRHLAALPQFRMPDRYLNKTRPSLPVECKVSEQAETLMRVCERVILAHGGERIEVDGQPGYRVRLQAVRLNHPWEVIEMAFEARGDLANPYVDGLPEGQVPMARATFTGASGPAQGLRHTLALFWDGAKTWKVRFAPPAAGEWTWSITSNDPGLDGTSGTFQVVDWTETEKQANPARRGFIRVHQGGERAGRYFEYADGTPFLWIGDTWWNWTKRGIQFSSFQRLADDRAAKGFTVGQLFFSPNGLLNRNFDTPNLEQIRKVEQMIAYANRQGITVWIHPWWSRERLNERVSPEQMRRWWRYVIARLGAYNTLWVLAGEYNMHNYGGFGLPFWQNLGAMVKSEDPYRRSVGVHPTPPGWSGGAEAPQWSTGEVIHREPWLDYNQSQVGHGRWRNEMIPRVVAADYARRPAKPTVVTEPWYEFIEGNPTGMEVRYGAWSAVLSGAAGHSYGGGHVWWAHLPESPASQGSWPLETSFAGNTLDYPGARSLSFLARFLGAIPWWTLEPHPELVSQYAAPLCAAVPGQRYVVYLRYGGALKVDLRPSQPTDPFEYTWTDLEQSQERTRGKVSGGAVRAFHAPEDYPGNLSFKDWLLHIRRAEP